MASAIFHLFISKALIYFFLQKMAGAFNIRIYSKYFNFVLFLKLLLKHLQSELQSLESVYNRLVAQTATLYTTASDERVKTLKEDHEQLENRWKCQTTAIPQRSVILNGSYDCFFTDHYFAYLV